MDLIVQGRSDQLAIVDSGIAITYGELNSRIQKFSSVLANLFEQKNQRIGVLIEHGAPALVAIFSILREGHCFVPLNPEFPFSRLEYTARDAELAALITTDKTRPLAEKLGSACEAASDRKSTRLNSSHSQQSRMPSSA